MNPHQDSVGLRDIPFDQGDVVVLVDIVGIDDRSEIPGMLGRQPCLRRPVDKHILPQSIGDEIGYRRDLQTMLGCEFLKIGHP
jgi:hypothetical protein